jgi:hypothetical protein
MRHWKISTCWSYMTTPLQLVLVNILPHGYLNKSGIGVSEETVALRMMTKDDCTKLLEVDEAAPRTHGVTRGEMLGRYDSPKYRAGA